MGCTCFKGIGLSVVSFLNCNFFEGMIFFYILHFLNNSALIPLNPDKTALLLTERIQLIKDNYCKSEL